MNNLILKYVGLTGLIGSSLALLISILLGFGGFKLQAVSGYYITGYVSRTQMIFLLLSGIGLIISGISFTNHARKQKIKNPNLMLLFCLAEGTAFLVTSIFGLTSELRDQDFWAETTFKEIHNTVFYNNLILTTFLTFGALQITLSSIFLKTKMLGQNKLSETAAILTLISGIIFVTKAIIDFPLIKEAMFILSFNVHLPFPNNILSIIGPLVYVLAQTLITLILLRN